MIEKERKTRWEDKEKEMLRQGHVCFRHLRRAKSFCGIGSVVVQRYEQKFIASGVGPRHFATRLSGGRERELELKEKIKAVEREIEEMEAMTWDELSAAKQLTFKGKDGFEKWKMAEWKKLHAVKLKGMQDIVDLHEKENILWKQAWLVYEKKRVNSAAELLDVLNLLFREYPQPRTTPEYCASISEMNVETPLLTPDDPLIELYSHWKWRMFDPNARSEDRTRHPIIALSCLPGDGKRVFLSPALTLPTLVDRLAEDDPKSWEPFALRFRNSIRLFTTFSDGADVIIEERKLQPCDRLTLRILYTYWFGNGDMEFSTFARKWLEVAEVPWLHLVMDLIKHLSGDVDVFLAVDEILRAHDYSEMPKDEFIKDLLAIIGRLLISHGPRFHAVVTSLECKHFDDFCSENGRPVEFVDITVPPRSIKSMHSRRRYARSRSTSSGNTLK